MAKRGQVVMDDVANKPITPLDVDEVVRVASKCTVPPFGHKVIHGKVNLVLRGCRLNVMTHGLEKRSPSLPLGIDVQTAYTTLANGSHRVPVVLRNNTQDWLKIKKGVPIARMVTANAIPKVTHVLLAEKPHEQSALTEAPPIAPLKPLACSGPGELLHVDFTSVEETVPLPEEPVIRNVMVMQDHFSKYVVAYVVKDQTAHTAAEMLRNGYFGLFGAPMYLVSDQGKAFTGHLISNLCELYGVQKLRTSPYHAQTNGQVERMNQTIIRMIGKLEQDKKAHWSEHLPEMLAAYNGTCSAVTGYSPYFLLFGRKSRMPVGCLFPTLRDSPHQAKMEVSVVAMQKRLKEAFAVARHLTSQEAARQRRYYDHKAGAVALQPGDIVMVCTDGFVGKRKVKDQWEDGGFIVESQLEDWPVYKVRCPTSDVKQKPKYHILHRNCLLFVTNEDDAVVPGQSAQAKVSPVVSNATPEAAVEDEGPSGPLPSLLTQQEGDMTSQVWLNGEFHMKPWTQIMSRAPESPPDQPGDEVSDLESGMLDSESEGT